MNGQEVPWFEIIKGGAIHFAIVIGCVGYLIGIVFTISWAGTELLRNHIYDGMYYVIIALIFFSSYIWPITVPVILLVSHFTKDKTKQRRKY